VYRIATLTLIAVGHGRLEPLDFGLERELVVPVHLARCVETVGSERFWIVLRASARVPLHQSTVSGLTPSNDASSLLVSDFLFSFSLWFDIIA
jgi:hypothetical protein